MSIRKSKLTKKTFKYPSVFDRLKHFSNGGDFTNFLNKNPSSNEEVKVPYKPGYNEDNVYTQSLLDNLLQQKEYSNYKPEDFYTLMDSISQVETKNQNIQQMNNGPGRGYYQLEPESLKTNLNRLQNYEKELGINLGIDYNKISYDNLLEQSKDIQRVIALAGILKSARAKGTYVNPKDQMNTWLDYHWIGGKERNKYINDRINHWNETFKTN